MTVPLGAGPRPAEGPLSTTVRIPAPYDLMLTLSPLRRALGDPTMRLGRGQAVRATRTPDGPATTRMTVVPGGVQVEAWGPGARWALAAAPDLLGADDDPTRLVTEQPLIRELGRRLAGLRIGRSLAVWEALLPAILEQKVAGEAARRSWRALVRRWSEAAPGPGSLLLPPRPTDVAGLPSYAFHPLGVERRRAETVRRAAREAARLEPLAVDPAVLGTRLMAIPGVGAWTTAEVLARAAGDPDAVSVGDFHLKHLVAWALAGEARGTDARMLELLEPFAGQRGRVVRLLEASGIWPPARGPRLAVRRFERD